MFPNPIEPPPKWWAPKLSPFWFRAWRPLRHWRRRRFEKLLELELRGVEHLQAALAEDCGVLITPNHPGPGDPDMMYHVADQVGRPFYFMCAWQFLWRFSPPVRFILRQHGCFSVDRDGTDLRAFKLAVEMLTSSAYPLVIFPEGEVYHLGERITPFREGPTTIALSAAKRAKRPVRIVPAAIKYHYLVDPTPQLEALMERLEQAVFWRPRPELSLPQRIYRLAEVLLAIKEIEHCGATSCGPLPERIAALREHLLGRLEAYHGCDGRGSTPERVKAVRQRIIQQFEDLPNDDPQRPTLRRHLDDVFLVVQSFSYPGDYVDESPSIERIAETLDKLEEDLLHVRAPAGRADRRGVVSLGEPIEVPPDADRKSAGPQLTRLLEERVQDLLDGIEPPPHRAFGRPQPDTQRSAAIAT